MDKLFEKKNPFSSCSEKKVHFKIDYIDETRL